MDTHASFNENVESIECCKSNITLIVDKITFGKGTLYIAESKLYWENNAISQVISINYGTMCKYYVSHHPKVHERPCLEIIVDFNYTHEDKKVDQNEDEEEEELRSIIKLVPDNPKCLNEIFEAIACVQPLHYHDDNEVELSDQESNSTNTSLRNSYEHEDSNKNSNTTISLTCAQENQEAGSIDISNQYHKSDAKNGEKINQVS